MSLLAWILAALPVALAVYAYAGYPFALWVLARFRRPASASVPAAEWPALSVCLPAYNEEAQIRGALEALLRLDYPADRLQILVVSDASTDATDAIVAEYADRGVELLRRPVRAGKTAAENAAVQQLRGEVVLNTDASIRLHPAAAKHLAARFADPTVGVASGRDVSVAVHDECGNVAEAGYVGYEMKVRALETRLGGIVGASGSCYAMRAELHRLPVRPDLSRDFSSALTARLHGFRAVSVDEAACFVPRTPSLQREYLRKVRTISRGMETLLYNRVLLDPFRHGAFAWKLWSHKVCRWLVPPAALPGVVGLALLAQSHGWAWIALAAGGVVFVLALAGWLWPRHRAMPRLVSAAAFGVSANLAVVHALYRLLRGREDHVWEPTRREAAAAR